LEYSAIIFLPKVSWTQDKFLCHIILTLGIGSSSYYGDLSSYSRPIQSTLDEIRWNVGGYYTHYFTSRWGARVGLRYVRIAGNDFNMGVVGKQDRFARNLHFRNDLKELSAVGIYNLNPFATIANDKFLVLICWEDLPFFYMIQWQKHQRENGSNYVHSIPKDRV
jgi:hypothetical protein